MKKLLIILRREYLLRLRKPSFWVLSLLIPVVLAVLYALPVLAAQRGAERTTVLVVDQTGLFEEGLQSTPEVGFKPMPSLDYAKQNADKHDLILFIPLRETTIPRDAFLYYRGDSPSLALQSVVDGQLQVLLRNAILAETLPTDENDMRMDSVVTENGAFYCDSYGFKPVEFDESQADVSDMIKVLYVQPHEKPYEAEIPNTLEAKQKAVGGLIEFVYNTDETALVCDEEAKLKCKEGNRYLDGGGIIAGNFLVVGLGEEDCRSLTDEEIQKYMNKFAEAPNIDDEETAADVGFKFIGFM